MDKVRVLVVDDEGVVIMVLENYLRSMGYEVVGRATSGDEAIDIARRLRPDAILMDIVMPGTLDGIDAAKIIKTELDIPVIFLTAYAEDQYIERAKAAEPFGYIVKPFREREIKAALEITLHRKDIERRLYKLEEIYRSMVDNVNEAIVSADSHGNIISWNQAAETMFGYLACEAVGKPITLIWPEGVRQAYQEGMGGLLSTGKSKFIGKTLESTGLRRGGGEFPLEFTPMAIKIKEGIFFTVVARDITKRKLTEDQLRNSHEQSQAFCTHLQSVEDEGKAKIASLIHDELGQNLIALGLNLNIIREQMAKKPSDVAFSRLEESLELVMRMIESARNLMAELRPPVLDDFGLMAGLEWFRDRFSSRMVMKVDVRGEELIPRTSRSVENALFRIAEEALTNVAEHAKATQVTVSVEKEGGMVRLVVADNGIGFDPVHLVKLPRGQGWGLITMQERAKSVGARFHIESRPEGGTRVVVEVPLDKGSSPPV